MPKAFVGNYRKVDTPKANSYKVRVVKGVVSDHRAFFVSYSKRIGVGGKGCGGRNRLLWLNRLETSNHESIA